MQSNSSGAQLLGIHLEGPFLNKELAGAMSLHLLRKGDLLLFERLRDRAGDALKYITLAPEVEGVAEMICTIIKSGVRVSMGHTNADYDLAMRCIKDGVTGVTHTFNAMRLFHQHEPAVMGAALESDIYCEAICDGFHLHPGSVRMLLKAKGYDRVIAVTDSTMAAGMPDGIHKIGGKEIIVENGDAKLVENGVRAGSTLTSLKALHNLQAFTGEPVEKLSALLSANPAKFIGLSDRKGSISKGFDADIVILDKNSNLTMTIAGGRIVYEKR
jgi:N-acetylglucosamine-6-phosphate deacetylase